MGYVNSLEGTHTVANITFVGAVEEQIKVQVKQKDEELEMLTKVTRWIPWICLWLYQDIHVCIDNISIYIYMSHVSPLKALWHGDLGCEVWWNFGLGISSDLLAGQIGGMDAKGLTSHICESSVFWKLTQNYSSCFRQSGSTVAEEPWLLLNAFMKTDGDRIVFWSIFGQGFFKYLRYG